MSIEVKNITKIYGQLKALYLSAGTLDVMLKISHFDAFNQENLIKD